MKKIIFISSIVASAIHHSQAKPPSTSISGAPLQRETIPLVGRHAKEDQEKKRKKAEEEHKKITLSSMTLEELRKSADDALTKKQYDIASKYIEQMMKLADQTDEYPDLLLELADVFEKQGFYDKACAKYTDFSSRFPGKSQVEYADRQAIATSFSCTLDPERDQTRTEETIAKAHIYLAHESYTLYREEIESILKKCYAKLIDADLLVCKFFLKRKPESWKNFKDVENRLKTIRSDYLVYAPHKEVDLLLCELEVAQRKEDTDLYNEKKQTLNICLKTNNEKTTPLLSAKNFANRF